MEPPSIQRKLILDPAKLNWVAPITSTTVKSHLEEYLNDFDLDEIDQTIANDCEQKAIALKIQQKLTNTVKKGRHLREDYSDLVQEEKIRQEQLNYMVLPSG